MPSPQTDSLLNSLMLGLDPQTLSRLLSRLGPGPTPDVATVPLGGVGSRTGLSGLPLGESGTGGGGDTLSGSGRLTPQIDTGAVADLGGFGQAQAAEAAATQATSPFAGTSVASRSLGQEAAVPTSSPTETFTINFPRSTAARTATGLSETGLSAPDSSTITIGGRGSSDLALGSSLLSDLTSLLRRFGGTRTRTSSPSQTGRGVTETFDPTGGDPLGTFPAGLQTVEGLRGPTQIGPGITATSAPAALTGAAEGAAGLGGTLGPLTNFAQTGPSALTTPPAALTGAAEGAAGLGGGTLGAVGGGVPSVNIPGVGNLNLGAALGIAGLGTGLAGKYTDSQTLSDLSPALSTSALLTGPAGGYVGALGGGGFFAKPLSKLLNLGLGGKSDVSYASPLPQVIIGSVGSTLDTGSSTNTAYFRDRTDVWDPVEDRATGRTYYRRKSYNVNNIPRPASDLEAWRAMYGRSYSTWENYIQGNYDLSTLTPSSTRYYSLATPPGGGFYVPGNYLPGYPKYDADLGVLTAAPLTEVTPGGQDPYATSGASRPAGSTGTGSLLAGEHLAGTAGGAPGTSEALGQAMQRFGWYDPNYGFDPSWTPPISAPSTFWTPVSTDEGIAYVPPASWYAGSLPGDVTSGA